MIEQIIQALIFGAQIPGIKAYLQATARTSAPVLAQIAEVANMVKTQTGADDHKAVSDALNMLASSLVIKHNKLPTDQTVQQQIYGNKAQLDTYYAKQQLLNNQMGGMGGSYSGMPQNTTPLGNALDGQSKSTDVLGGSSVTIIGGSDPLQHDQSTNTIGTIIAEAPDEQVPVIKAHINRSESMSELLAVSPIKYGDYMNKLIEVGGRMDESLHELLNDHCVGSKYQPYNTAIKTTVNLLSVDVDGGSIYANYPAPKKTELVRLGDTSSIADWNIELMNSEEAMLAPTVVISTIAFPTIESKLMFSAVADALHNGDFTVCAETLGRILSTAIRTDDKRSIYLVKVIDQRITLMVNKALLSFRAGFTIDSFMGDYIDALAEVKVEGLLNDRLKGIVLPHVLYDTFIAEAKKAETEKSLILSSGCEGVVALPFSSEDVGLSTIVDGLSVILERKRNRALVRDLTALRQSSGLVLYRILLIDAIFEVSRTADEDSFVIKRVTKN